MGEKVYVYTAAELIELFPCNTEYVEVDIEEVKKLVEDVKTNAKTYHDIHNMVYEYVKKNVFDQDEYYSHSKHTPEEQANEAYFDLWYYGYDDYKKEKCEKYNIPIPKEKFLCVHDWVNAFEHYYLAITPAVREYKEAVEIVVDEWMKRIFEDMYQDPDRLSADKSSSPITSFLGSKIKDSYMKDVTQEQMDNMRKYLREFYMGNDKSYEYWKPSLSVDYHPDSFLTKVYEKAGIDAKVADSISPWKTVISIDREDNSVRVNHKYW